MVSHAPTKAYVQRRTAEGLSKPEIMRCLKRYVARELFPLIQAITIDTLEEGHANLDKPSPLHPEAHHFGDSHRRVERDVRGRSESRKRILYPSICSGTEGPPKRRP